MKSYHAYLKEVITQDPDYKKELELESWLMEISLNIVRLRKERGYSQEEFANKLGMSQSSVARLESGQNMRCSTLWKISDVLDENLELFGANKEEEKTKIEYFCNLTIKDQKIDTTAQEKEFEYSSAQTISPFRLFFNPKPYGKSC